MKIKELVEKLEGIQSIESVMKLLFISRQTAIQNISKLRKEGYVKTRYLNNKKRVYNIFVLNKLGGKSYYQIINEASPIKLTESEIYKIYGREPSFEETLIYAIKTKKLRVILASISLFKYINNWTLLGNLSRKNRVERKVGALYDLARQTFKIRRMDMKFRKSILPIEEDKYLFIIKGLKSKDFTEVQDLWKIYIPFNKSDLKEYK